LDACINLAPNADLEAAIKKAIPNKEWLFCAEKGAAQAPI